MPEAPVYGDLKVATRPLDAPQINPGVASAEAFGVGEKLSRNAIAQGAAGLGMGIIEGNRIRQAAAEKAQQERNDFEVLDASNQTIDAVNDIKAKAFQVQGSNAIGLLGITPPSAAK